MFIAFILVQSQSKLAEPIKQYNKIDRMYNYTELNKKYKLIEVLQQILAQSVFLIISRCSST